MNNLTESERNTSCPKRIKLNTSKYLQKTLFEEGRASDVKIIALNKEWNLHKIFLEKSPYFQFMFSGSWIETTQKEINIRIEDVNITTEALNKVFESLYVDETVIEPSEVIPILACATLFQLDDLIYHCAEIMKACIKNVDTAVFFYTASDLYSIIEVKKTSLDWLYKHSMMYRYRRKIILISVDLMRELVTSPELYVEHEGGLFMILFCWMFSKVKSVFEDYNILLDSASNYYRNRKNKEAFLETDSGIPYQPVFRALRLQNLILYMDIEEIEKYNVIPKDWFNPFFKIQWCHVFRTHQGSEKGPMSEKVSEEQFNRECIREHMVLSKSDFRKSGFFRTKRFDFGFGLAFLYEDEFFYIMRDVETENNANNSVGSVSSNNNKRNLMYRITLYSNDNGNYKAETGLKTVSVAPNEKIKLLTFKFPRSFYFSLNFKINVLLTTPYV